VRNLLVNDGRGVALNLLRVQQKDCRHDKWSSVAVSAALAVAGVGASVSAEAHPYLTVGVDVPVVAVVGPFGHAPVYCGRYCYEHGRYWRRNYDRYRFDRFPRDRWYRR
jgi:hypothetical protein